MVVISAGVPVELELNNRRCYTIKQAGDWLVEIIPMIYNFRVVLTPVQAAQVYDHGWCYFGRDNLTFARAYLAAIMFDPDVDLEPAGFDKRATRERRSVHE